MNTASTRWIDRARSSRDRVLAIVLATVMICSLAAAGGAAPVLADDDPPVTPASYYGEIELNGEPAPEGTPITATIDGEVRGSITVEEPGQYGGPGAYDEKLQVNGTAEDEGKEVRFFAYGQEVEPDETVTFESGDVEEVDLSGEDIGLPEFAVSIDEDESALEVPPGENATVTATVTNEGGADDDAEIEFEVDGEVEDERTVPIPAGESETLTFVWETPDEEGEWNGTVSTQHDSESFTISAEEDAPPPPPPPPEEPQFTLTDLDVPDEVDEGSEFDVSVEVTNIGEAEGETTVQLRFAGETRAEKVVELGPEESETISDTFLADVEPGEYSVTAFETADESELSGSLQVVEPPPPPPEEPAFELSDLETPAEVEEDEIFETSVTVTNEGTASGETTVSFALEGVDAAEETVELAADESETVTVELTASADPDEYTLSASESATGEELAATIEIVERDVDDREIADPDDDGSPIPGFGTVVALVALLIGALAIARRSRPS